MASNMGLGKKEGAVYAKRIVAQTGFGTPTLTGGHRARPDRVCRQMLLPQAHDQGLRS
jgi:hypothetical protein